MPPVAELVGEDETLKADLVISIGGDGSFLRAARWVGNREIPILGINSGHLGFLADVTLEESDKVIEEIARMDLSIGERIMLHVEMETADPEAKLPDFPFALNEVAVLRDETASMISVDARLNGDPLAVYKADGLIIATPTGSTGYNLSVGGPIVTPSADCLVISPVAAHSLTMRPLVVPAQSEVTLRVDSRMPVFRLSIDSCSVILPLDVTLKLSRAPFVTKIAHRRDQNFAGTLREKMLWGIDAR